VQMSPVAQKKIANLCSSKPVDNYYNLLNSLRYNFVSNRADCCTWTSRLNAVSKTSIRSFGVAILSIPLLVITLFLTPAHAEQYDSSELYLPLPRYFETHPEHRLMMELAPIDKKGQPVGISIENGSNSIILSDAGNGKRHFEWTPSIFDTGLHEVIFKLEDSRTGRQENVSVWFEVISAKALAFSSSSTTSRYNFVAQNSDIAVPTQIQSDREEPAAVEPAHLITAPAFPTTDLYLLRSDSQRNSIAPVLHEIRYESGLATKVRKVAEAKSNFSNTDIDLPSHQYSRLQAWNTNETLMDIGDHIVDVDTLEPIRRISLTAARNWSNLDGKTMYGVMYQDGLRNSFGKYDIETGNYQRIWRSAEFTKCTLGKSKGNISNDDRFAVLSCADLNNNLVAVSLDLSTGQELGRMDLNRASYRWISFSQTGKHILLQNTYSNGNRELISLDRNLKHPKLLTTNVNHGDLGIDDLGNDVFVMINWRHIYYYRLSDGVRVTLDDRKLGDIGGGHISCRSIKRPGWCYFSTTSQNKPYIGAVKIGVPSENESKIINDHFGEKSRQGYTQYEHWGFTRTSVTDEYIRQAKATVSQTGLKVLYISDWYGQEQPSVYTLELK